MSTRWAVTNGKLVRLDEYCWVCAHAGKWQRGPGYWLVHWHLRRMAR